MQVTQHTNKIWTINDFMSPEECSQWIAYSEQLGYKEAEVSLKEGAKMMKGLRNNYRLLYTDKDLAALCWERLKPYCPSTLENHEAVGLNEQFRFYKYELDQRFKRHIDGRFTRNEQEESRITFMVYLNEDFEGGETSFDEVSISPKTGTALCFIHEIKHEGSAVKLGSSMYLDQM